MASGFNTRWSSDCNPFGKVGATTKEDSVFKVS